ncbi:MAG: class I SAM-dependent methyltransferase [Myxococcota bacterium]
MRILNDPRLEALLDRLHAQSSAQNEALMHFFVQRMRDGDLDWRQFDAKTDQFMRDKFVALDRDKAELCYTLCRALRARRVVEAGTSFGVSTLYLAAAVRDNLRDDGGSGHVVGTEYEPEKAKIARGHFAEAGLADWIDLREGDLRESLKSIDGPIDFMLIDIWTPMSRPALELVAPHLRRGAIVMCDNTTQFREPYKDYFEFVNDPKHELRTLTLPFEGGLELTVRG